VKQVLECLTLGSLIYDKFLKKGEGKKMSMLKSMNLTKVILFTIIMALAACGTRSSLTYYHDPNMDFGAVRTVAVLPFENLTSEKLAGERVRDIFANSLLATGAVYVFPSGEVARGIARAGLTDPTAPSQEEVAKFAGIIKADVLITGVVREYGEVRSGAASANIISFSLQMIEVQTQRIVWTASSTKGGISVWDRLFGSGGEPMNDVTMAAIDDILNKLFK